MSDGAWVTIGVMFGVLVGAALFAWLVASVAIWFLVALRKRLGLHDE